MPFEIRAFRWARDGAPELIPTPLSSWVVRRGIATADEAERMAAGLRLSGRDRFSGDSTVTYDVMDQTKWT